MKIKAQIWSVDMLIGVALFLVIVSVFFGVLLYNAPQDFDLRDQSEQIFIRLDSSRAQSSTIPQIFNSQGISDEELQKLYFETDYEQLKADLGINGEFCIVLLDDSGSIREVTNASNHSKSSFGNQNLFIAEGIRCGE